jgi:hypothetical protein
LLLTTQVSAYEISKRIYKVEAGKNELLPVPWLLQLLLSLSLISIMMAAVHAYLTAHQREWYRRQSLLLWYKIEDLWFKIEDLWFYSEELWYELTNWWHGLCFAVWKYRIRLFSRIRMAVYRYASWAYVWPKILWLDLYQATDNFLCCGWDICAGIYGGAKNRLASLKRYGGSMYYRAQYYKAILVYYYRYIVWIWDRRRKISATFSVFPLVAICGLLGGVSNDRQDTDQAVTQHCQPGQAHQQILHQPYLGHDQRQSSLLTAWILNPLCRLAQRNIRFHRLHDAIIQYCRKLLSSIRGTAYRCATWAYQVPAKFLRFVGDVGVGLQHSAKHHMALLNSYCRRLYCLVEYYIAIAISQ